MLDGTAWVDDADRLRTALRCVEDRTEMALHGLRTAQSLCPDAPVSPAMGLLSDALTICRDALERGAGE